MRTVVCAVALVWALACIHASGNYAAIRRYLWVMAADIVIGGVYLSMWPLTGWPYLAIYAALTGAIACAAALVAWQGVKELPVRYRLYGISLVSIATLIAVGIQWGFVADPQSRVTLLAAGLMFPIGILTLCSSLVVDVLHDSAFRTLGLLWCVQGFMLFLFATGAQWYPRAWASFGEWLPAAVFAVGMAALGMNFKEAHLVPVERKS